MVVILHRTPGNRLFVYIMFKLGVTEKFECFGVDVIWEGGVSVVNGNEIHLMNASQRDIL